MLKGSNHNLKDDLLIVAASTFLGVLLWHAKTLDNWLSIMGESRLLGAFLGGFFYTLAFTTIPAAIFLAKISQFNSPFLVAFLGASGALIVDTLIFYFVRDQLIADFMTTLKKRRLQRLQHLLKSKIVKISAGITGGLLIAAPLPTDETAMALLGFSQIKTYTFLLIAFSFNFTAIYLIAAAVNYFG